MKCPNLVTHQPGLLVGDLDLVKQIFQSHDYYNRDQTPYLEYAYELLGAKNTGDGLGIVGRNGKTWEQHRKIANKALLAPQANKKFISDMNVNARRLVEKWQSQTGTPIDVRQSMNEYTFSVIIKAAFGITTDATSASITRDSQLLQAVQAFFEGSRTYFLLPGPQLEPLKAVVPDLIALKDHMAVVREFGFETLEKTREAERAGKEIPPNFASGMFLVKDEDGTYLDAEDVITDCLDIIIGGTDTTATALMATMFHLGQPENAEAVENIRREILAAETMRLYPPAPTNGRVASVDTELGDVFVPKDTTVAIPVWALQRYEENFPSPLTFIPTRFTKTHPDTATRHPFAWMPFGAGGRVCLGQRLSLAEARIALAHIVRAFNVKTVTKQEELQTATGITLGFVNPIEVVLESRK
ncbi:Cytochrome P450 4d2 [Rhizophlyctis rosea]|nr:Cytochrome P450 4d2 [Rhizophlyctis rosea]